MIICGFICNTILDRTLPEYEEIGKAFNIFDNKSLGEVSKSLINNCNYTNLQIVFLTIAPFYYYYIKFINSIQEKIKIN